MSFLGASVTMVAADALIINELEATEQQVGLVRANEGGYRQAVTPRELLGRMSTTMRSANRTMAVVGALLGGIAAGALGYSAALWGIVLVFLAASLLIALSPVRGARA